MFEQPQNPAAQPFKDPRNTQEMIELNTRESIDNLSLDTSKELYQIDAFSDGKQELPDVDTPITQKYREAIKVLEGKTPEELKTIIDPEGKFNPQEFTFFEISVALPGAIHVEDRDFEHKEGGELVSQERMREIVLPSKEMVNKEIARRYESLSNAPKEFQQHYSAIYSI